MQSSAITPSAATTPSTGTDRGVKSLTSGDFFKMLVTELQQQDPMQPTKTGDMLNQVSQIRSIELSSNLSNDLDQLAKTQRTTASSALLGKFVTAQILGNDGSANEVSGVVTGVRFDTDGSSLLELDTGQTIRSTDVVRVTTPDQANMPASALTSPTNTTAGKPTDTKQNAPAKPNFFDKLMGLLAA